MFRTIGFVSLLFTTTLLAQVPEVRLPDAPLGERTTGNYDVSFKPFANAKPVEKRNAGEISRWTRDDMQWTLIFEKTELPTPLPLNDVIDPANGDRAGYLSISLNSLRSGDPTAEVYRSEILDLGKLRVGMIIASTKSGENERAILQRAIIEVSPRVYYGITMRSPAPIADFEKDKNARQAAMTFRAMVNTVAEVDRTKVREDQDERLFRTKAILLEWSAKKIRSVLVPEQFLRVRHEGKDIGYIYVIEEPAESLPKLGQVDRAIAVDPDKASGFRVGLKTHTKSDDGKTIDSQSWLYVTNDRKHEVWSMVSVGKDPAAKTETEKESRLTEVGSSDFQSDRVFDKKMTPADYKELDKKNQTPYREVETYKLSVMYEGHPVTPPSVERDLPPFYTPQAINWILPRLMPRDRAETYLFAAYANTARQLMLQYVDVGTEQAVSLGGKSIRAIPISLRIGDEEAPVVHYVTQEGAYAGTVNRSNQTEIIPTDRESLLKIWKDADLTPPSATKK